MLDSPPREKQPLDYHRQLYQSTSLKEIAFDVYVSGLVKNMRQTYATDEKNYFTCKRRIRLSCHRTGTFLLKNELLT